MNNPTLLLFLKNPIAGQVKTRIAATVGNERALAVYQRLLHHTRQITQPLPCAKWVFYSHFIAADDEWQNQLYQKRLQTGADLGQRMYNAFAAAFEQGSTMVVIIGTDCLQLQTQHLAAAFKQLQHTDIVIGPATDGGYYLLGMKQLHPLLFQNKAWSTARLLTQTLQTVQQLGLQYHLLPTLSDVDTWQDWLRCGGTELP